MSTETQADSAIEYSNVRDMLRELDSSMSRAAVRGFEIIAINFNRDSNGDTAVAPAETLCQIEGYGVYARHFEFVESFWLGDFETMGAATRALADLQVLLDVEVPLLGHFPR